MKKHRLSASGASASRRAIAASVALAVIGTPLVTAPGVGAESSEGPQLRLSADETMVNDRLAILGSGVGALLDVYEVQIGGVPAWPDHVEDSAIEFKVPVTERGLQAVTLKPKLGMDLAPRKVGDVRVSKAMVPRPDTEFVRGHINARLAPGVKFADVALAGDVGVQVMPSADDERLQRWYRIDVAAGAENERILAYAADPRVEVAEYDPIRRADRQPNDMWYGPDQWNVRKARLPSAWEVQRTGWAVAIIDSGVRATHEDLQGLVVYNRDMTGTGLAPCGSHGTHVASIAAGRTNNSVGIAGAAWASQIGSYKVLGSADCTGTASELAAGINWAVADGFRVINMSLGSPESSTLEGNAVAAAWDSGAVLVASAGNGGQSSPRYPAAYPNVLGVANSTSTDARYYQSNWGSWVGIAAPGTNIYAAGAEHDGSYLYMTGTSMAAPLVAGSAALVRARRGLNNAATLDALRGNADPIDWGSTPIAPGGRLNAYRAVEPTQACIRDVPAGAWVRRSSGEVYQVQTTGLRFVPDMSVYSSWRGINTDHVPICEQRFAELSVLSAPIGYRPASLVKDPTNGLVYLITTDGTDRGLPLRRLVATGDVFTCMGWNWGNIREGTTTSLALHPLGPPIETCNPLVRSFPNGSVVRASGGQVYVVESGTKRFIPSFGAYASWFNAEHVAASETELNLLPDGPQWGYRPGRQLKGISSVTIWVVADDGAYRAQGSKRSFSTLTSWTERSFSGAPVEGDVPYAVMSLHPSAGDILDADWMP